MPLQPNEPVPEEPEGLEERPPPQDSFRRIYFGQISEPLVPEPDLPSLTPEDELTRAALEDPDALKGETIDPGPTTWRWVFLLLLTVGALGIVFWKR